MLGTLLAISIQNFLDATPGTQINGHKHFVLCSEARILKWSGCINIDFVSAMSEMQSAHRAIVAPGVCGTF